MKLYKALLLLALLWGAAFDLAAQTAMSDTQVMQFMIKENEKGTPRTEIVTKLIERGVSIEQFDASRTSTTNSRMVR